ncbi:hypothetical protein C8Q74DRAFT_1203477 [Fomes fomentarius]|nr:hypothetical protein C8Q74DRAFT_1203477 [Fomes fomentarius]
MPVPSRGILLVYTDPGRAVPSPVYERWHDTEHVWPLLNLPGPLFLTATRWTAADTKTPGHLAIYDLASPGAVHDPSYAELSTLRKEPRVDIVRKVERMERRVYEPLIDESHASRHEYPPPYQPGKYMTIAEMELETYAEAEFNRWFDEEHIPLLACVPGWVRSRRFVLKEWYGSGREVKEERPPKYLALHEWSSLDAFRTKEFKRATTTPWRMEVLKEDRVIKYEMRVFRVARNWQRF